MVTLAEEASAYLECRNFFRSLGCEPELEAESQPPEWWLKEHALRKGEKKLPPIPSAPKPKFGFGPFGAQI